MVLSLTSQQGCCCIALFSPGKSVGPSDNKIRGDLVQQRGAFLGVKKKKKKKFEHRRHLIYEQKTRQDPVAGG